MTDRRRAPRPLALHFDRACKQDLALVAAPAAVARRIVLVRQGNTASSTLDQTAQRFASRRHRGAA
jgi:hypothetical protein